MKSLNFYKEEISSKMLREMFLEDFHRGTNHLTKKLLEVIMEQQRDEYMAVEALDEELCRSDYRNGYYLRELRSRWGLIEALRVPRSRSGEFYPKALVKYERVQGLVDRGIAQMYLRGVSTGNVGPVLKALLGYEVSSGYVTGVNSLLDQEVRTYQRRELVDEVVYLFFDGIYLKDRALLGSRKRPVLVAYAIYQSGRREFIHFRIAKNESEAEWSKFLQELVQKGLKGSLLELIITDGCPGLIAALEMVYPYTPRQRCWVHKLRNVTKKIKKADAEECLHGAQRIYSAPHKKAAIRAFKAWKIRWQKLYPNAVHCIEEDLESLLAFFDFTKQHRKLLRTTNVIERGFGEVRRRTKVMGCLPNGKAINRIVYARFAMLNNKWARPTNFVKGMQQQMQLIAA